MRPSKPRQHHYVFAHRVLPGMALSQPARFISELRGGGDAFLRSVWDRVAEDVPTSLRLTADGLAFEIIDSDEGTIAVVVLPEASGEAEAHFVALVVHHQPEKARFFTLESAFSPVTQSRYNVLGEWTEDSHLNFGEGPSADQEAFVHAVMERVRSGPT